MERTIINTNKVYLTPCKKYTKELVESALIPMLENCIKDNGFEENWSGVKVVIKPNLLAKRAPEAGVTAHPVLVEIAARYFVTRGASVIIADSPGGIYHPKLLEKLYETTGMQKAAENSGATLNYDTSFVQCGEFPIIKPLAEANLIVSIGRLKTHMMCNMTAAVKNLFGSIPGAKKAEYHSRYPEKDDFSAMLVRLCQQNAPQINIIDAIVAMEGDGPGSGTLKKVGALCGSANPFALDLLCCAMMGFEPEEVRTVEIGRKLNLCPMSIQELSVIGAAPEKYFCHFKRPNASRNTSLLNLLPRSIMARLKKEKKPQIVVKKCIGCGECARSCPAETIEIVNSKAVIHYENCIKCYCCQELCPKKAVVVK